MIEYCVGCRQRHDSHAWRYMDYTDENGVKGRGWFCRKHFTPLPTKFALKAANYSPEELLAGKDLGIKGVSWGEKKSTKTYSEERRDAIRAIRNI